MTTFLELINLDLVIVIFVLLVCLDSIKKGFIAVIYNVISLLLSLYATYLFAPVLSRIFQLYKVEGMLSFIGDKINQSIITVILFFVLYTFCMLVGGLIKPVLESIFSFIDFTGLINGLLGGVVGVLKGIIYVYIILVFAFLPFCPNGTQMLEESTIGQTIINIIPFYYDEISSHELLQVDLNKTDANTVSLVTRTLYKTHQNQSMSEEEIRNFIIEYYSELDNIDLNEQDVAKLRELCQYYQIDKSVIKGIK